MPRLRNTVSGVVVSASDDTAARLSSAWGPAGRQSEPEPAPEEKPAPRRGRPRQSDK